MQQITTRRFIELLNHVKTTRSGYEQADHGTKYVQYQGDKDKKKVYTDVGYIFNEFELNHDGLKMKFSYEHFVEFDPNEPIDLDDENADIVSLEYGEAAENVWQEQKPANFVVIDDDGDELDIIDMGYIFQDHIHDYNDFSSSIAEIRQKIKNNIS